MSIKQIKILVYAQNIVFIALRVVGRYYHLNKHGVIRYSKSRRNFKKFKKICSGCRRSQRHEKLEAKLAGLTACFAYEQRNFYSNSVIINRLRRPQVNTLQENFSSNHRLKRKFSIFYFVFHATRNTNLSWKREEVF